MTLPHALCSACNRFLLLIAGKFIFLLALSSASAFPQAPPSQVVKGARDVSFQATVDGSTQHYVLLLPDEFDPRVPHNLLIALHGHGSDRWQFMRPTRDEVRATLDTAKKHQLIYVTPDYRAKTSWMGPKAEADVLQIILMLKEEYRIRKIFLCGASMGGTGTLTFAVLHPNLLDGIVSMNGTANLLLYDHFQDAIQNSFGGTKQEIPMEYKKRSAEYWPERLTMSMAVTLSGKDTTVPPDSVERLTIVLKNMGRNVKVIYREEEGHRTGYKDAMEALANVIDPAIVSNPAMQAH